MNNKMNYVAIEVPMASKCNLACTYCYIPKNKALHKIHDKWAKSIRNGEFISLISETFEKEKIKNFSMWGAEPSIGFRDLDVENLLNKFENLKEIATSTNATDSKRIINFIRRLNNYVENNNREIRFNLQLSLDGPKKITDRNRGLGVYDKVINTIHELYKESPKISKLRMSITIKSTNSMEDFEEFTEKPNVLKEYIKSFHYLSKEYENKKWPRNFNVHLDASPTLVLPGRYAARDGKIFYNYILKLEEVIKSLQKENIYYKQYEQYYIRLENLFKMINFSNTKARGNFFGCAGGRSMLTPDPDGTKHGCHGSLWFNYDDYLNIISSDEFQATGRKGSSGVKTIIGGFTKDIIAPNRDKLNEKRLSYILASQTSNFTHNLNIAYSTTKMLAISGQINSVYKKDSWARLFAYFITLENYCWINNKYITGTLFANNLSIYRIYGNGVFEHHLNQLYKNLELNKH